MPASEFSAKIPIRLALFASAAGAIACLWAAWCLFPCLAWNEVRLAPAFALRHGINPYPPLDGGPLSTWIYGPVGMVVNLPATFATSPTGALHLASMITALTILVPVAVIFFGSTELRARSACAPWLALALSVLLVPTATLLFQVPDQSAIALGLLSGWCLARQSRPTPLLVAAAALSVLAILAKQLEVVLLPVNLAFLLISGQRAAALRYLGWATVFGVIAAAICLPFFGFANLWLNLVVVPGQRPWGDLASKIAARPWPLIDQVVLPSAGLVALWRTGRWPDRARESGRFFLFATLAYGAMLPLGLAAFFKFGGDTNTIHSWNYLLPGALLAYLATDRATTAAAPLRLLALPALALTLHAKDFAVLPARPITRHFEIAAQLTDAFPHAIWFPQNPLITFYADGRLWHSEDGIRTRNHAGFAPRQVDFRRDLPPALRAVAYPESENLSFATAPALLPEFSQRIHLPYWTLLTRPPVPPTSK